MQFYFIIQWEADCAQLSVGNRWVNIFSVSALSCNTRSFSCRNFVSLHHLPCSQWLSIFSIADILLLWSWWFLPGILSPPAEAHIHCSYTNHLSYSILLLKDASNWCFSMPWSRKRQTYAVQKCQIIGTQLLMNLWRPKIIRTHFNVYASLKSAELDLHSFWYLPTLPLRSPDLIANVCIYQCHFSTCFHPYQFP